MAKLPGQKVRGSNTGRPIMVLLDGLGKRWTLRIIWELSRRETLTFRELRRSCSDVSPTSLNQRIKDLRELALIESGESGYCLTEHGKQLADLLAPLERWSNEWGRSLVNQAAD